MSWIDAHCHLADPRLEKDLLSVLARSRAAGVTGWVQGGVEPTDWDRQADLKRHCGEFVFTSYGVHPWWVVQNSDSDCEKALELLEKKLHEADALGELGLDRAQNRGAAPLFARQDRVFDAQLGIFRRQPKPLVLHVVQAHPEALTVLKRHAPFEKSGFVHSFSTDFGTAKQYLDLGLLISIGGAITRKSADRLRETVRRIPLDQMVIETDCPDQLPSLPPGKKQAVNEPAFLVEIARTVARCRGESVEKILEASTQNVRRILTP